MVLATLGSVEPYFRNRLELRWARERFESFVSDCLEEDMRQFTEDAPLKKTASSNTDTR